MIRLALFAETLRLTISHSIKMSKKPSKNDNTIARNKKAWHDYFIEEEFEAGLALKGWEVKSLREGRAQLTESYVIIRNGELFLFGAYFSPLPSTSTHITPDPTRSRKLLLHVQEISKLVGGVEKKRIYPHATFAVLEKR